MAVRSFIFIILTVALTGCVDLNGDWFNMSYNQPKPPAPGSTVTTTTTTTTVVVPPANVDSCSEGQDDCAGHENHHSSHHSH